jgi:hypothetical protein
MPLPPPTTPRERLHVRSVVYEGWQRGDGLVDIEAHLVDAKDHDYVLLAGTRPAGEPVHDMWVRVTIDLTFNIRELVACTDRMPYPGACDQITDRYPQLVGCNLMHGFRKDLFDALGGVRGCSHLTELIAFLPTAALQTFAGLSGEIGRQEDKPFQLDRCHALEHTTETVRRYYPRWYRSPANANANAAHKEMS